MVAALLALGPWLWLIAGLVLLALELFAPGAFMMWFGLAALAVGLLSLAVAMPWQAATVLFVALALAASCRSWRRVAQQPSRRRARRVNSSIERARMRMVGRVFTLSEPIHAGQGRIRVDDSSWGVEGPELPAGTEVRVVSHDGTRLKVIAA